MMNGSVYSLANITNATRAESEDIWLHKGQFYNHKRNNWAYFTYTPSIAWAWRPQSAFENGNDVLESLNVGYLDDEVIFGIGIGDNEQAFARAKAETLLQCLRACPGMSASGDEVIDMQNTVMEVERQDEMTRRMQKTGTFWMSDRGLKYRFNRITILCHSN
jgi:hypothetical protein